MGPVTLFLILLFAAMQHIDWRMRFGPLARAEAGAATMHVSRRARRMGMSELLPGGGRIRKLWLGEADAYRDHLLRLDRESRYRRFSGAAAVLLP